MQPILLSKLLLNLFGLVPSQYATPEEKTTSLVVDGVINQPIIVEAIYDADRSVDVKVKILSLEETDKVEAICPNQLVGTLQIEPIISFQVLDEKGQIHTFVATCQSKPNVQKLKQKLEACITPKRNTHMPTIEDRTINITVGEYLIVSNAAEGGINDSGNGAVYIVLANCDCCDPGFLHIVQTIRPKYPTVGFGCKIRYDAETNDLVISDAEDKHYILSGCISGLGRQPSEIIDRFSLVFLAKEGTYVTTY